MFKNNNCFSNVFPKHKACVYLVFCSVFSRMCLLRLMLRNCFDKKAFFLKMMVNFIFIIFRVNLHVYLQN